MKKLTLIAALFIISAMAAFAQTTDEAEVRKFIADYDQAYLNQDISFLEKNLAPEYSISSEGTIRNLAQVLEEARKEKAAPTEKVIAFKSTVENVQVIGNVALAAGSWSWTGASPLIENAEPHTDTGRFSTMLEKRSGRWLVVYEHFSEGRHDKKLMEAQVLKMGLAYNEMIRRGDPAEIEKLLADDYLYTDEDGKVLTKEQDLATYKKRQSKIESIETTDQKVRIIGNSAAVETATFHVKGTEKDGKPFDQTYRYTTTWVFRNLRWQIVADHTSEIKK